MPQALHHVDFISAHVVFQCICLRDVAIATGPSSCRLVAISCHASTRVSEGDGHPLNYLRTCSGDGVDAWDEGWDEGWVEGWDEGWAKGWGDEWDMR